VTDFDALAMFLDGHHNAVRVRLACEAAGLDIVDLVERPRTAPRVGLAWRVPVGQAAVLHARGTGPALAAPPAEWLCSLPVELTGRRLAVTTVEDLLAGRTPLPRVRLVKLAEAKHRGLRATAVDGEGHAAEVVRRVGLPGSTRLLVADGWLDCASEYRTFCVGREVVGCSPYLVEGESWSPGLVGHRASFHAEACRWVEELLAGLADDDVPPACVLDVARLEDGRFALLEVNTSWGAGLYGCDPTGVLRAVLAANRPVAPAWRWRPDPGLLQLADASGPAGAP
jgi:hypothetical protein